SKYDPLAHSPSTYCVSPPAERSKRVGDQASAPSNSSRRRRISSQIRYGKLPIVVGLPVPDRLTLTSRCGSLTGSERRTRLFSSEKIAVFAPIASASDTTATAVVTRSFAHIRHP